MWRSSIIWIVSELIAGAVFTLLTPFVPLVILIAGIFILQIILYFVIVWGLWKKESKDNLKSLLSEVERLKEKETSPQPPKVPEKVITENKQSNPS